MHLWLDQWLNLGLRCPDHDPRRRLRRFSSLGGGHDPAGGAGLDEAIAVGGIAAAGAQRPGLRRQALAQAVGIGRRAPFAERTQCYTYPEKIKIGRDPGGAKRAGRSN